MNKIQVLILFSFLFFVKKKSKKSGEKIQAQKKILQIQIFAYNQIIFKSIKFASSLVLRPHPP